jgi:predicted phosphodiesterase
MRVLVMSDIHANYTALEAVIEDAGKFDAVWCLGDVEENRVTILTPDGGEEKLSLRSKAAVAEEIIGKIASLLE